MGSSHDASTPAGRLLPDLSALPAEEPVAVRDRIFMQRALHLAAQAPYTTDPNPRVGCVLVRQDLVVGEGFHVRAGELHAERHALAAAGGAAQGATAYVTLEPCSHTGRTGPCAEALIQAGVARVVVAMQDPNPLVAGQGLARLRAAGVDVQVGVLEAAARALNPGFIQRMATGRPHVRLKLAMSLDGRTAMASGESQWITGAEAREDVQRLRARSSAIVTGIGTVLADDAALTVRPQQWRLGSYGPGPLRPPLRVVLDRHGRTPAAARVVQGPPTLLLTAGPTTTRYGDSVTVLTGDWTPAAVLAELAARQCNEVLLECGARLAGGFMEAGLVDELIVYMAPKLLGSSARPLMELPLTRMSQALSLELVDQRMLGSDWRLCYVVRPDRAAGSS